MAKVITFSRTFPAYHPKKGQPTYFVEKFIKSFDNDDYEWELAENHIRKITDLGIQAWYDLEPKYHTIRGGHRFKAGDYFSPRFWGNNVNPKNGKSGPYHSNQITFAPDTKIVKTWDFELKVNEGNLYGFINGELIKKDMINNLAKNDGLTVKELNEWFSPSKNVFKNQMKGQIICWNESVNY